MSRLTNWLLIPPVSSRLSERYRHYRHHGASSLSAALGCLWMILAWMFIPLEHPRWQRIRARHGELYPHINPDKPRPLDPARYAIQSIWLLTTSTGAEKKTSRWRSFLVCRTCVNTTTSGLTGYPTGWATKRVI